nr:gibberellin 2-beta-dioxygenase 1-like [Ipomoea batatas]
MVVLSKFSVVKPCKPPALFPADAVPLIDLSKPDAKHLLVKACEEFGFFKVVNHGVPSDFIATLESEALRFFSAPLSEKLKAGPPDPFGYGNKNVGACGDIGWVEYILLSARHPQLNFQKFSSVMGLSPENFRAAVDEYVRAVKRMGCEILELLADGLMIHPRNVFSKLLMDEQSDSVFRLNHYPPCPELGKNPIGFGEHTDPQIISVLRSNNTSGLQIALNDGSWMSVPPDQHSFFINVGDSLQVMTNGRFKSVRHRVLSNSAKSRLSMIYFGGPPLNEKIAPLPSLMEAEQDSLYREFTWFEFKKSAFSSRLAVNRLVPFEKIAAS